MPKYGPLWIVLTLAYCSVIFYLSSLPDRDLPAPAWLDWSGSDKAVHMVIFGGLAGLVSVGLRRSNPAPVSRRLLFLGPVLFAVLYGISDEFHQAFVPMRSPDALDLLADAAGATIIAGIYTAWAAHSARPKVSPAEGNSAGRSRD